MLGIILAPFCNIVHTHIFLAMRELSIFFCIAIILAGCDNTKKVQTESTTEVPEMTREELKAEPPVDREIDIAAEVEALLIGAWQWEKTICCGRLSKVISADSSDYELFLKFNVDSTVEFYHDEDLEKKVGYSVTSGNLIKGIPELTIEGERTAILRVTEDQLILDYSYIDLQTEYYYRVEEVDD